MGMRWIAALLCALCVASGWAFDKPRLIIETDAGGDPDDEQSLVRYLVYANEFETEGIIANRARARDGENRNPVRDGLGIVQALIKAYGQCHSNLVLHAQGYPTAEELLKVTVPGYADRDDGVELIIRAVDDTNARGPVWFSNWGTDHGSAESSLKRALDKVRRERGLEGYSLFKSKIRLSSADKFGEHTTNEPPFMFWLNASHPEIDRRRWYHRFSAITAKAGGFDIERDVRNGHGPLGAMYPTNTTHPQKEGDTMMFLYLVQTGMNDPRRPELGSWAGRYARNPAFEGMEYYWATAEDTWNGTTHRENTLARWAADLQNDFRARMDWCVATNFTGANHPPKVVLNPVAVKFDPSWSKRIRPIFAGSDQLIELTAEDSSDPDAGQKLTYSWFIYPEAGTYKKEIELSATNGPRVSLRAPLAGGTTRTAHVIVRVQDNGEPPLVGYARAEIIVEPSRQR